MVESSAQETASPTRLLRFSGYFQNYMGASTVVVAALPVPATMFNLIPVHEPDKGSTTVITSLSCFLLFAFIFYSRHRIAKILFHESGPQAASAGDNPPPDRRPLWSLVFSGFILLLIIGCVALYFAYQNAFMELSQVQSAMTRSAAAPAMADVLRRMRMELMAYYVGFFALAEAAFVLMATKEYLQDLLKLSDRELILGRRTRAAGPGESTPPSPPTGE